MSDFEFGLYVIKSMIIAFVIMALPTVLIWAIVSSIKDAINPRRRFKPHKDFERRKTSKYYED